jgi:4-amino-4-deoxy-L-arabinose transferase-like glycosyltransferase
VTTTSSRTGQHPPRGSGLAGAPIETPQAAHRRSRWELPGLAVLLIGTGVLYLWQLAGNGWANTFYAAAVQAGTKNWTALFFGSLDSSNAITVDKPPASLWVMALSGRIFGFSSWSMLAPQALMGVGAVALLWATVRRISGPGAGLLAATVLALTPVAALMFRFNNPDALLVLLMVAAAYCTLRAIEKAGTRWLLLAGLLIGFGFLTKMLQVFLVVPGLALAYLWAAPASLGMRIRQLLAAGVAIIVGAGWWLVAVALWPVSSRPYIGGSTDNSPLELALGYNGLSRIFGQGHPDSGARPFPAGGAMPRPMTGGAGGLFGGHTGLSRLFTGSFATQAAWLLPAALLLLVVGLWLTRRAPRTDLVRAGLLLWGGWVLGTALVLSYMNGIIHQYYTVTLAPGIAAVLAIGGREVWQQRHTWLSRIVLAIATAGTVVWAQTMLSWSPEFLPWLRWVVLVVGVIAAVAFLVPLSGHRWLMVATIAAVTAGLIAPTAYAVETVLTPRSGPIVTAGPPVIQGDASRLGGFPAGFPGMNKTRPGGQGSLARGAGAMDGRDIASTNTELVALLKSAPTKWSAATISGSSAASLELASGTAVLGVGGFMGSDPYPTLDQFKAYQASGQIRYFVAGPTFGGRFGGGFPEGDGGDSGRGRPGEFANGTGTQISQWVKENFTPITIDGQTIYNLSQPKP